VLQPILVVQNGERYKVIAGERRLRASKLAGLERIPARVITSNDKGIHEIALRENLDRVDLHPLEEGEGYLSLLETKAYTSHEAIATAFGKPKSRITECIGFTKLPDDTKKELMRLNVKQRSVLRKLLSTPPESHAEAIKELAKTADALEDETIVAKGEGASSVEKKTPVKRKVQTFEYVCDAKGIFIPTFRWKVGEGHERLKDYIEKLTKILAEAKKLTK